MAIEFGALTGVSRPTIKETATQMRGANYGYGQQVASAYQQPVDYMEQSAKSLVNGSGINYAGMEQLLGSENVIAEVSKELSEAGSTYGIEQVASSWSKGGACPINDGSGFSDKYSDGVLGAKFDSNRLFA